MSRQPSRSQTEANRESTWPPFPLEIFFHITSFLHHDSQTLARLGATYHDAKRDWNIEYYLHKRRLFALFDGIKGIETELKKRFNNRKKEPYQEFVKVMIPFLQEFTVSDYKTWSQQPNFDFAQYYFKLVKIEEDLEVEECKESANYYAFFSPRISISEGMALLVFFSLNAVTLTIAALMLTFAFPIAGAVALTAVILTAAILLAGTLIIASKNQRDIKAEYSLLRNRVDVARHHIEKICQSDEEAETELAILEEKFKTNKKSLTTTESENLNSLRKSKRHKASFELLENDRDQVITLLKTTFPKTNSTGIKHILSEINESKGQISARRLFALIKDTCKERANRSPNKIKLFFSAGRSVAAQTFYDAGKDKKFADCETRRQFIAMLKKLSPNGSSQPTASSLS